MPKVNQKYALDKWTNVLIMVYNCSEIINSHSLNNVYSSLTMSTVNSQLSKAFFFFLNKICTIDLGEWTIPKASHGWHSWDFPHHSAITYSLFSSFYSTKLLQEQLPGHLHCNIYLHVWFSKTLFCHKMEHWKLHRLFLEDNENNIVYCFFFLGLYT